MVHSVTDGADFKAQVAGAAGKLVVVDFTASWCGPCKRIAPVYERLSKEFTDVVFLKVDVDDVPDVTSAFGVSSMPTFVFVRVTGDAAPEKSVLEVFSGANEEKLRAAIEKYKN